MRGEKTIGAALGATLLGAELLVGPTPVIQLPDPIGPAARELQELRMEASDLPGLWNELIAGKTESGTAKVLLTSDGGGGGGRW
jgi:hypothetical protein